MDIVAMSGVCKHFGDKEVLHDLNLCVPEHSVFGFVGRNGAGKTTAMKAILGLLKVDAGEISVCGERVAYGQTATNRHIGYLPDVPAFYSFMTAREYLKLCGESLNLAQSEICERSEELLTLVGLAEEKHRIKGYSRGMKQRLGIAQALLSRPKLLICDEPTSALDPIGRREILDILSSVRDRTTVLFSTHILSDVERICTDVAFLHGGKIAMQGTASALKDAYASERFSVEMTDEAGKKALLHAFPKVQTTDGDALILSGGEAQMQEVLSFLAENKLSVRRIERLERSLEELFLEVVAK